MAAVQPERILELIETLAGRLIAAVDDPPIGRKQRRGPQVSIAVPPVARAAGRATGAKNASRGPIDLFLVFLGLQALAVRGRRRASLQPGLDRRILGIEVRKVGDQV